MQFRQDFKVLFFLFSLAASEAEVVTPLADPCLDADGGTSCAVVLLQRRATLVSVATDVDAASTPDHDYVERLKRQYELFGNATGRTAPLTEAGYQLVAKRQSDEEMKAFILRLLATDGKSIDIGGEAAKSLDSLAYSHSHAFAGSESFVELQQDLQGVAWTAPLEANVSGPLAAGASSFTVTLTEIGYQVVAAMRSNAEMQLFIRRFLAAHLLGVCGNQEAEASLKALVPQYSGLAGVGDSVQLRAEMKNATWTCPISESMSQALVDGVSGCSAPLSESGYGTVAALRSAPEMEFFLRRQRTAATASRSNLTSPSPLCGGSAGDGDGVGHLASDLLGGNDTYAEAVSRIELLALDTNSPTDDTNLREADDSSVMTRFKVGDSEGCTSGERIRDRDVCHQAAVALGLEAKWSGVFMWGTWPQGCISMADKVIFNDYAVDHSNPNVNHLCDLVGSSAESTEGAVADGATGDYRAASSTDFKLANAGEADCAANGGITDESTCRAAASALGLADAWAGSLSLASLPGGCILLGSKVFFSGNTQKAVQTLPTVRAICGGSAGESTSSASSKESAPAALTSTAAQNAALPTSGAITATIAPVAFEAVDTSGVAKARFVSGQPNGCTDGQRVADAQTCEFAASFAGIGGSWAGAVTLSFLPAGCVRLGTRVFFNSNANPPAEGSALPTMMTVCDLSCNSPVEATWLAARAQRQVGAPTSVAGDSPISGLASLAPAGPSAGVVNKMMVAGVVPAAQAESAAELLPAYSAGTIAATLLPSPAFAPLGSGAVQETIAPVTPAFPSSSSATQVTIAAPSLEQATEEGRLPRLSTEPLANASAMPMPTLSADATTLTAAAPLPARSPPGADDVAQAIVYTEPASNASAILVGGPPVAEPPAAVVGGRLVMQSPGVVAIDAVAISTATPELHEPVSSEAVAAVADITATPELQAPVSSEAVEAVANSIATPELQANVSSVAAAVEAVVSSTATPELQAPVSSAAMPAFGTAKSTATPAGKAPVFAPWGQRAVAKEVAKDSGSADSAPAFAAWGTRS